MNIEEKAPDITRMVTELYEQTGTVQTRLFRLVEALRGVVPSNTTIAPPVSPPPVSVVDYLTDSLRHTSTADEILAEIERLV